MPTRIIVCAFDQRLVRRSSFSCGRPELDRWLRQRADAPGTLLAVDTTTEQVAGYVAAGRYQLVPADGPDAVPEVLRATLVRFAVSEDYHHRGVGRLLLLDALRRLGRAPAAARLVVVHAFDEAAAGFYGRHGFRRLPDHRLTLYLTDRRLHGTLARLGRGPVRATEPDRGDPRRAP